MPKNKTVRNVFFAVFCLFACVSVGYAESCSTVGATQNKYTPNGCTYDTSVRTCCSNKQWSEWGKDCCSGASCCSSSQCWNGSSCEAQNTNKCGDQANMVYSNCVSGTGWLYYCVCKSDGSTKQVYKNDAVSCPDLSCSSVSGLYVDITTYSVNPSNLCSSGVSSYNSQCTSAVSSWYSSMTKCYSGYKKTTANDRCITSYSAAVLEPQNQSDYSYKLTQACDYGRSMSNVTLVCKAAGVKSTCW